MHINKRLLFIDILLLGVINVIIFCLPIKRNISIYLSDLFIVLAAALALYSSVLAFSKSRDSNLARSRFFGWPIMLVGKKGLAFSVLMNVALMVSIQYVNVPPWAVLILNLILLTIIAMGLTAVDSSRNFVEAQRMQREVRTQTMKELRLRSKQLVDICQDPVLQRRLKHMSEEFRNSDPNSSLNSETIENKINTEIDVLEGMLNTDTERAVDQINNIERLLKKRNSIVLSSK